MPSTRFAPSGTAQIAYDVAGQGHPLVMLHSGLGDRTLFDEQVDAFAASFTIVRIDLRGFGETVRPAEPYLSSADVLAVVDALGFERFHVLGVSMGSQVAIEVAVVAPERVTALVAVSARCGTPAGDQLTEAWAEVDRLFETEGVDAAVEREAQMWVDGFDRSPEDVDRTFRARLNRLNRAVFLRTDTDDQEEDIDPPAADRLDAIVAPTLVMWGAHDFPVYREAGPRLVDSIRGATGYEFANSAHLPNNECPAEFNARVIEFLTAH